MNIITLPLLIRLSIGLILGLWVAFKLRGPLRALTVRLMPVRHRISPDSFHIQTRISTLLTIILVITITILTNWGIRKAGNALGLPAAEQTETMEFISAFPEIEAPAQQEAAETDTASSPPIASVREPNPVPQPMAEIVSPAPHYYLQIFAFVNPQRARDQLPVWEKKTGSKVWMAVDQGTEVPFKVLIGPFRSREETVRFRKKNNIEGFPRTDKGILLVRH